MKQRVGSIVVADYLLTIKGESEQQSEETSVPHLKITGARLGDNRTGCAPVSY